MRRSVPLATVALAIIALYLYDLDGVGVLSSDEPRYAAIGRAMAAARDFITPRLWGVPWFEKPPLLYWMTAAGTAVGLNSDLCGRVPVALLSLLFLGVAFVVTKREFGTGSAAIATCGLATSAGWMGFSSICVTDLPLAVCYSTAVLSALPLLRRSPATTDISLRFLGLGVSMGFAILAKGLVPIALALPFLWFLRRYWRFWWIATASALLVALPWYLTVYRRNGSTFIDEFFIRHHLQRLYSSALQHVQPWYYYFPVLLLAIFPWTPMLGWLFSRRTYWDGRRRFLLAIVIFGFLFFSFSVNKLPGYLLPLLPPLFILLGSCWEDRFAADIPRPWLLACACLASVIPYAALVLPQILAAGKLSATVLAYSLPNRTGLFFTILPIVAVTLSRRSWAGITLVLCIVAGVIYLKATTFPVLDRTVSVRSFWQSGVLPLNHAICDGGTNRDWLYGLSYYRGSTFPPCDSGRFDFAIRTQERSTPELVPLR